MPVGAYLFVQPEEKRRRHIEPAAVFHALHKIVGDGHVATVDEEIFGRVADELGFEPTRMDKSIGDVHQLYRELSLGGLQNHLLPGIFQLVKQKFDL